MPDPKPTAAEIAGMITVAFWAWPDPADESAPPMLARRWLAVAGMDDGRYQLTLTGATGSLALVPEPVEAEVAVELLAGLADQAVRAGETIGQVERLADVEVPVDRIETLRGIGEGSASRGLRVVMEWYLARNHGP
jgi:hypothetical protein